MKIRTGKLWQLLIPIIVFIVVITGHFVWLGIFPEQDPAQNRWTTIGPGTDINWLQKYIANQDYWLGFSYALSFSFAAYAIYRYLEERARNTRNFAIGGLTFSGFLAVAGCFLIGCCGSPMLIIYLNLFGAAFLPLAKPLMAAITTISIAVAWIWMERRKRTASSCDCTEPCRDKTSDNV